MFHINIQSNRYLANPFHQLILFVLELLDLLGILGDPDHLLDLQTEKK